MNKSFFKYQGTGNDFILIDDRDLTFPATDTSLIANLCDRRFGIGGDGLILLQNDPGANFYMQYFNSDGRESSMCGNGGRCLAAFAKHLGIVKDKALFRAVDGLHEVIFHRDIVDLKMNDVTSIDARSEEIYVLDTGSPHYVKFMHEDLNTHDIVGEAKGIRYDEEFPNGINVNFVAETGKSNGIRIRTYERGVEDETLSCGTGVTASAIALALRSKFVDGNYTIPVEVLGGKLEVSYEYSRPGAFHNIWLKGPAEFVFEGVLTYSFPPHEVS